MITTLLELSDGNLCPVSTCFFFFSFKLFVIICRRYNNYNNKQVYKL